MLILNTVHVMEKETGYGILKSPCRHDLRPADSDP